MLVDEIRPVKSPATLAAISSSRRKTPVTIRHAPSREPSSEAALPKALEAESPKAAARTSINRASRSTITAAITKKLARTATPASSPTEGRPAMTGTPTASAAEKARMTRRLSAPAASAASTTRPNPREASSAKFPDHFRTVGLRTCPINR